MKEGCPSLLCKRMGSFLVGRVVIAANWKLSSFVLSLLGLIVCDKAPKRF